jgi:ArsR family transcriptional regulator, arsenate/arsenite/antimonite-responsive transcriptional repressor
MNRTAPRVERLLFVDRRSAMLGDMRAATTSTIAANAAPLDDEALAAFAKALAHPVRVRIMRVLDERCACVTGDVVLEIGLAQSTVSEHLRILREVGLIQGEIEGPRTRYCVNRERLTAFKSAVAGL